MLARFHRGFHNLALTWSITSRTRTRFPPEDHCINPVFPALDDLDRPSSLEWVCQTNMNIKPYLKFCVDLVNDDVAVPPTKTEVTLETLVLCFFFHLAGMNFDSPFESNDSCVQPIQRIACITYFPQGAARCPPWTASTYLRPCPGMNRTCDVDCCDVSDQCVYNHTVTLLEGGTITQRAYVDADAPSAIFPKSGARRCVTTSTLLMQMGSA